MTTSTLTNAVDTCTRQKLPSKNYAQAWWLSTGGVAGDTHFAYIFFNRPFPLGATITSAKLQLHMNNPVTANATVSCGLVANKYSVSSVNYNNQPGTTGALSTVTQGSWPYGSLVEIDITAQMQSVSNGTPWWGLRLSSNYTAGPLVFCAAQHSTIAYRPKLIVTWSMQPQAPDTLYPDGGRAVVPALPLLRSNFHATDGATALKAVQVQVDNTAGGNFNAPAFDSGAFLTGSPEIDLSAYLNKSLATFDAGTENWIAGLNCSIAQDTAVKNSGAGSLKVTATAAGTTQVWPSAITPVVAGNTYAISAYEASSAARPSWVSLFWYDANNAFMSQTAGAGANDSAAFGIRTASGVAPAGATGMRPVLVYSAAAAGEVHNWDDVKWSLGSTSTFAGLTDGQTGYWRIKVQDTTGQWSAWSKVATFARASQGALAITSPPNGGISNDSTPPVNWTFNNQSAYQVYVKDSAGKVVYDSGRKTSTDKVFTIPNGMISKDNTTYTIYVRTWDGVDRENIPGYPTYVEAYTSFYYDYDAATGPATNLVKTVQSPYPWVQLDWARSTQPDQWEIQRDGVIIEKVPGYQLLVAGTNYRYTDRSASPRDPHTWKVVAVTNNKSSANSPTVSATLPMETTLLAALDGSNPVFLYNPNRDIGRVQVSQVFDVVGDNPPVLITQSLKGARGTIKGRISSLGSSGLTAAAQLASFKYLAGIQGTTMLLYYVNQGLKVVAYNFTWDAVAMGGGDTVYDCAFDFFEVK